MTGSSDELLLFAEATPWEEAQRALEAAGVSDGLPMVPPSRGRLGRMLAAVEDRQRSYGLVPPLFGDLTAEAVAYRCVLAGCTPTELPVVLTAVAASLEADFNLLGIQTTTGTPTVAVVVHGPIAPALGMNSGTNCLGPGNRANACIGRAVQLVLTTIGGARPGIGDMATMGQPGKYTFCFAEHEQGAIPPLHVRRGLGSAESAVTVLGVSGTMEVLPTSGDATPEGALRPLRVAMIGAREASGAGRARIRGEQFALIPPEIAGMFAGKGWDIAAVQRFLCGDGDIASAPEDIHLVPAGGPGIKMTYLPLWAGGTRSVTWPLITP